MEMSKKKATRLVEKIVKLSLAIGEELDVCDWADKYRKLSKEGSADPGQWKTSKTPYMIEILKCITDRKTRKVTIMSSSQVGKTEMLLNLIGRFIHLDPCSMLLIQPTLEMAKSFSHERLTPMIRDTEPLKRIVSQDNNDTILRKKFPGGYLKLIGSNSPSELASRPIKIVLMDEVDRFPLSAGKEGSPIELAEKRTTTFHNSKSLRVSTPTIDGISVIQKEFRKSSQEEWALNCPSCGEYQVLRWENIKWSNRDGKTVQMMCDSCGTLSNEKSWKENEGQGRWIAENPEEKVHRGFSMNALASPWISWSEIVNKFYEDKDDPNKLQTFYNTILGRAWIATLSDMKDFMKIYNQRISYGAELHGDIKLLTAGVDVQNDRLEVEVVGYGVNQTSYGVLYKVIYGNPEERKTWDKLDELLQKNWHYADGRTIRVASCLVDSGHSTNAVYEFVSDKEERNIFAIKGIGGDGKAPLNGFRITDKEGAHNVKLLSLGVNALKDIIYSRLDLEDDRPGRCYFSDDPEKGYTPEYFKGLTSEVKRIKHTPRGSKLVWEVVEGRKRNEPLDIRNYANAAMLLIEQSTGILEEEE